LSTHVHNTSSRPGLFLSIDRNFSKGVMFSNQNFPEVAPQKNVSAYFSPNYYTAPVPHFDHDQDRAAAFSIYSVTRYIHDAGMQEPISVFELLIRLNRFFCLGKNRNRSNAGRDPVARLNFAPGKSLRNFF